LVFFCTLTAHIEHSYPKYGLHASVLRRYDDFGLDVVKKEKREWPAQRCEYLGITLDSVKQVATLSS